MNRILIIKHGSLGDIVFSLPIMHSIRTRYPNASINVLTEKKYFNFLYRTNFFNNIIEDNRSNNIFSSILLLIELIKQKYDVIIDLQNSTRTTYYHLFISIFGRIKICSSRKFAHIRYYIPPQGTESVIQGLFNQIKLLGIPEIKDIDYNWLKTNLDDRYKNRIILFIPGVSKNGKEKQWDPTKFGKLAKYCEEKNYYICIVGTKKDEPSVLPIINICKKIINNIDSSPPEVIYSISQIATLIISNDTGPGHIAALTKKNILWLVNDNSVTKANIPNTPNNFKISSKNIKSISTEEVINFIETNNLI